VIAGSVWLCADSTSMTAVTEVSGCIAGSDSERRY
jgi:hypothetical protein